MDESFERDVEIANLKDMNHKLQQRLASMSKCKTHVIDTIKPLTKAEIKFMGYTKYLQTDYWKALRKQVIFKNGQRVMCIICKKKKAENAHHLGYAHLGEPDLELLDIIPVCKLCHGMHHKKIKPSKWFNKRQKNFFKNSKKKRKKLYKGSRKIFSWNRKSV